MLWQDLVIAIANVLFTYSLANQVRYGFRKKQGTLTLVSSALTAIGLYNISFAFFTLTLYFSAAVAFTNATLWFILFAQRARYG